MVSTKGKTACGIDVCCTFWHSKAGVELGVEYEDHWENGEQAGKQAMKYLPKHG